jgi:hypothetical protein
MILKAVARWVFRGTLRQACFRLAVLAAIMLLVVASR